MWDSNQGKELHEASSQLKSFVFVGNMLIIIATLERE